MSTNPSNAAWTKILATLGHEAQTIGRTGCIPVFDASTNSWRIFRNTSTIHSDVENVADPAKVDLLRLNAKSLLERYPETIPELERLGVRVRALLNRQIESFEDVVAWADSVFNTGPVSKLPNHVQETTDLMIDDWVIEVKSGKNNSYVIPAAPQGSGVVATLDFSAPSGSRTRYGPRHEFTQQAFGIQIPKVAKPPRYRGQTAEGEPRRGRGRPRKDGLPPGSPEAKRADRKAKLRLERQRQAKRQACAAKLAKQPEGASITEMPKRPRLARVGQQKKAETS